MGMIDVMPTIGNMIGIKNQYALGNDIFTTKEKNIVPFPDGDYLTNTYYYSSSKDESYIIYKNSTIPS
jgi:phosphoglycerol transferase MdoB-like AlkP superfamily enzyme